MTFDALFGAKIHLIIPEIDEFVLEHTFDIANNINETL